MSKRPKILTALTVPTGGWDLEFYISDTVTLDTPLLATVAAGEYFVAWDGQSDDLLWALQEAMWSAINGAGLAAGRDVAIYLDADRKVNIGFRGTAFDEGAGSHGNDVQIDWTLTSAGLVAALGVDGSSAWTSTGTNYPTFTAERQHAWGWYAIEDGQLADLGKPREDEARIETSQAVALSGGVATVHWATRYESTMDLGWLTAAQTWSDGVAYGSAPAHRDYAYNQALECWYLEARKGTRFRVYENDPLTTGSDASATEIAVNDASNAAYVQDSSKAWSTDPQEWVGWLVQFATLYAGGASADTPLRFYVASNTATRLSSPNSTTGQTWEPSASRTLYLHDGTYKTYVLDTQRMSTFQPRELPRLDRYQMRIPLLRYIA